MINHGVLMDVGGCSQNLQRKPGENFHEMPRKPASTGAGRIPSIADYPSLRFSRDDPWTQTLHVCESKLGRKFFGMAVFFAAPLKVIAFSIAFPSF